MISMHLKAKCDYHSDLYLSMLPFAKLVKKSSKMNRINPKQTIINNNKQTHIYIKLTDNVWNFDIIVS